MFAWSCKRGIKTNDRLSLARVSDSVHSDDHVCYVVERVKDTEHVHSCPHGQLAESTITDTDNMTNKQALLKAHTERTVEQKYIEYIFTY